MYTENSRNPSFEDQNFLLLIFSPNKECFVVKISIFTCDSVSIVPNLEDFLNFRQTNG